MSTDISDLSNRCIWAMRILPVSDKLKALEEYLIKESSNSELSDYN